MNESNRKNAKDQTENNERNSVTNALTNANHIDENVNGKKKTTPDDNGDDVTTNDANSMRIILPVFIENEQKYAQIERRRKIQSSPAKTMRRSSQDSSKSERPHNVSILFVFQMDTYTIQIYVKFK